jgi:hypothetical protein
MDRNGKSTHRIGASLDQTVPRSDTRGGSEVPALPCLSSVHEALRSSECLAQNDTIFKLLLQSLYIAPIQAAVGLRHALGSLTSVVRSYAEVYYQPRAALNDRRSVPPEERTS